MKQSIAYGMEKLGIPFVIVECKGQIMYFMIDSGSSHNHLLQYAYDFFVQHFEDVIQDSEGSVYSVGLCGGVNGKVCSFSFFIDRTMYEEEFVLLPNSEVFENMSQVLGGPICGILGSRFLKRNNIVIDYGSQCLYTKRQKSREKTSNVAQEAA